MPIFILSFGAALLPIVVYILLLRWLDRYEPEPFKNIFLMFLLGAIFSTGFSFVANTIISFITDLVMTPSGSEYFSTAILAPIIEETSKGMIVLLLALFSREFDNLTDGIIYGAVVGLGFAFAENVYYFVNIYASDGVFSWLDHIYIRGLYTTAVHACSTSIFGAAVGVARYARRGERYLTRLIGLMLAIMVHSFWNSLLTVSSISEDQVLYYLPFLALPLIFLFLFLLLQYSLHRESQIIEEELTLEAQEGFIPLDHVRVLKSYWARSGMTYFNSKETAADYIEITTDIAFRRNQVRMASPKMKPILEGDLTALRSRLKSLVGSQSGGVLRDVLVVAGVIAFFVLALVLKPVVWNSFLNDFPATQSARVFIRNHPDLKVWLGAIKSFDGDPEGDFDYSDVAGDGHLSFAVTGTAAAGTVALSYTSPDGKLWVVNGASLHVRGESEDRKLTVPEDWLKFAQDSIDQNNLEEARLDCQMIHEATPDELIGDYCDALILDQQGDADKALATLEAMASKSEKNYYPQSVLAETYYNYGFFDKSLNTYLKVYDLRPEPRYAAIIGGLYLDLKKSEDALKWLETAKKNDFDSAGLAYGYGKYYQQKGQVDEAQAQFERARNLDPTFAAANFALGDLFEQKNETLKAAYYYECGVMLAPVSSGAERRKLVDLLIHQQEFDAAIFHLRKGIAYDPKDVESYVWLASLYALYGREDDAGSQYQFAKDINVARAEELWKQDQQVLNDMAQP